MNLKELFESVNVIDGIPKASQAPDWATHAGLTDQGSWHWLEKSTPAHLPNNDEWFPEAGKKIFSGYTQNGTHMPKVIKISKLEK